MTTDSWGPKCIALICVVVICIDFWVLVWGVGTCSTPRVVVHALGRSELDRLYILYSPPHCEQWTSNLSLTGRSLNQATPSLGSYRRCGRRDSDTVTKSTELSHERETSTPHLGSRRTGITLNFLGRNPRGSPPSGSMPLDPQQQRKILWLV